MLEVDVRARLGDFRLDARFRGAPGGVTVLYGPSGAGKSSVLAAVAGALRPEAGRIALGGEVLFDSAAGIDLPMERRRIGWVFQDARLFPHLSVEANLRFGLRRAPPGPVRFEEAVEVLGVGHLLHRRPRELSGGERQRVALARALVTEPACVLADEPTGNLDHATAQGIFDLMLELSTTLGTAFVIVTHDPELAGRCDRVLRMTEHGLQPAEV